MLDLGSDKGGIDKGFDEGLENLSGSHLHRILCRFIFILKWPIAPQQIHGSPFESQERIARVTSGMTAQVRRATTQALKMALRRMKFHE